MPDDFTSTPEAAAAYERLHGPGPERERPTLADVAEREPDHETLLDAYEAWSDVLGALWPYWQRQESMRPGAAVARALAERDRYREALEAARQSVVELLGCGFDSERLRVAQAAFDAITNALSAPPAVPVTSREDFLHGVKTDGEDPGGVF